MNWLFDNYKWLFGGVAGTAAVTLIGFLLRRLFSPKVPTAAPVSNGATATASPTIDNIARVEASPHIQQTVFVGSAALAHPEPQPRLTESARLVPLCAREVRLDEDSYGVWQEAAVNLQRAHPGIVLPFKNMPKEPGEHTPRANDVSAGLVFRDLNRTDEIHISHGVWLGHVEYTATFNSGVSHELLIALKSSLPFVTLENPKSYDPFSGGHFKPRIEIFHARMRTIWNAGTVEIVLVDGQNVTKFQGTFDYRLSSEKMCLVPRSLNSGFKVHFVPDHHNCGWSSNDYRTDFRASGLFTYDGDGSLTIVDALVKGAKPKGQMLAQVLVGDGFGPTVPVRTFELRAQVPVRIALNLMADPIHAERGKALRGQLVLRDVYNKEYEIDPIDFPWIGHRELR